VHPCVIFFFFVPLVASRARHAHRRRVVVTVYTSSNKRIITTRSLLPLATLASRSRACFVPSRESVASRSVVRPLAHSRPQKNASLALAFVLHRNEKNTFKPRAGKFQICVRVYTFTTTYILLYIVIYYCTIQKKSIQSKHPRACSKSDVDEDATNATQFNFLILTQRIMTRVQFFFTDDDTRRRDLRRDATSTCACV